MAMVVHESSKCIDEKKCCVVLRNLIKTPNDRCLMSVLLSTSSKHFHSLVSEEVRFMVGTFDLIFIVTDTTNATSISMTINEKDEERNLEALGFNSDQKNYVDIKEKSGTAVEMLCPALPPETDDVQPAIPDPPPYTPDIQSSRNTASHRRMAALTNEIKSNAANVNSGGDLSSLRMPKLVGLVNQAMTCYLNSLIQTLFMTPEFRNALYRWESDWIGDTSTSIPYQLQHLFLLLQTSDKQSVETTGLTRSFGWDSSEAWQQHDIQELCRVMFDALEKKFEGTDQADLIKQLYEGKMKDYVQCCECSHESARDDTFLDVPITIRPFGSNKTYKSVLEGLNAFVEPETLDDTNQYYCEKCDKKCDAKKGLKFTKFPYLLTLQLKRFDFDYSTMHRIKLNDRMSFPQILNLNSFTDDSESSPSSRNSVCDDSIADEDSSSHDSGHDFEPGSSSTGNGGGEVFTQRNSSEEEEDVERSSVDEGIDIDSQHSSSHDQGKSSTSWWQHNETVKRYLKEGPFVYELFSVMVHSGSAAGGHYYAYIKSFEDKRWYSFNDQVVSPITQQDIEKTYGGTPYSRTSTYYSSFSSSTNAYMLMYRQICAARNTSFMKTGNLPSHILKLLEQEREEEKQRQMRYELKKNLCTIQVFCRHPSILQDSRTIMEGNLEFHKDMSLQKAVELAHSCLKLDSNVVPLDRCRLVKFDHINDVLDRSFDLDTDDARYSLSQLLGGVGTTYLFDLLLETRKPNETFQRYERGGVTIKVYVADHKNMSFHQPFVVRSVESHTVLQLKVEISQRVNCLPERLLVAYEKYCGECVLLQKEKHTLKQEGFFRSAKVYIDLMSDEEHSRLNIPIPVELQLEDTALGAVIDKMANVITVNIMLPPDTIDLEVSPKPAPEVPTSSSPKISARNPASPSSDEGVGSFGGSGNGDSPPCRTGEPQSGDYSPSANSITSSENESSPKVGKVREDLPASESSWFWKIPEIGSNKTALTTPGSDNNDYKAERKRNNSYDDDALGMPNFVDLQGKIQEKLEGYASGASPTSSLRCEDSGSSHSGQNSFITDVDFEADNSLAEDDTQRAPSGAVGSEAGSLSNSCSTLDSTDTLCNTTEPRDDYVNIKLLGVMPLPDSDIKRTLETDQRPVDGAPDLPRPVLTRSYPGRAVSCAASSNLAESTITDYNKALRYADNTGANISPYFKDSLSGGAGTGDPSDCTADPEVSAENASRAATTKMKQCATSPRKTPPQLCLSSGRDGNASGQGPDSSTVKNNLSGPGDPPRPQPNDPESGEGNDQLKPLFSSDSSPPKIATFVNQHFQPLGHQPGEGRERTVSSSSVASDAWGATSDVIFKHDFFKILSSVMVTSAVSSEDGEPRPCKVISVEIDKRMTLLCLKRHIAPIIGSPTRRFCVYRQYTGGQETEVSNPTDDFRLVNDGSKFVVRLGRALRKDEYRCKLFLLSLDEEDTSKPFMNWVLTRGMTIEETKRQLANDIAEQCGISKQPDSIRLRKKTWRSPGQIYLPPDVFGTDISLYGSLEFYVEFLDEPEIKTKRSDLIVYSRRWFPSELRFSDFEEIVVSESEEETISYLGYSLDYLIGKVSDVSGIPKEHVRIAKGRGIFPYRISVFYAESELEWLPTKSRSHPFHMSEDGVVMFYKDDRDLMKDCTDEERREIEKEEQKFSSAPSTKYSSSSSATSLGKIGDILSMSCSDSVYDQLSNLALD